MMGVDDYEGNERDVKKRESPVPDAVLQFGVTRSRAGSRRWSRCLLGNFCCAFLERMVLRRALR